ncbi:MAG TPA: deoxyribose-phosphate aldolase [Coleofasciculaceae cyanobacterium]
MAAPRSEINLAEFIDHSLLTSTATPEQVAQYCEEADRFGFATVCVNPVHVRQATELLHNKRPQVCAVIGFPSGAHISAVKRYEAEMAVEDGATELDMVINLSWVKIGNTEALHQEIAEICEATGKTVKAILELSLLTESEIRLAAEVCMDAGVTYLKTHTGWHGGATVADVALLSSIAKDRVGIKASGSIRTAQQAIDLILAGATRLGTSRGVDLIRQRDTLEEGENKG